MHDALRQILAAPDDAAAALLDALDASERVVLLTAQLSEARERADRAEAEAARLGAALETVTRERDDAREDAAESDRQRTEAEALAERLARELAECREGDPGPDPPTPEPPTIPPSVPPTGDRFTLGAGPPETHGVVGFDVEPTEADGPCHVGAVWHGPEAPWHKFSLDLGSVWEDTLAGVWRRVVGFARGDRKRPVFETLSSHTDRPEWSSIGGEREVRFQLPAPFVLPVAMGGGLELVFSRGGSVVSVIEMRPNGTPFGTQAAASVSGAVAGLAHVYDGVGGVTVLFGEPLPAGVTARFRSTHGTYRPPAGANDGTSALDTMAALCAHNGRLVRAAMKSGASVAFGAGQMALSVEGMGILPGLDYVGAGSGQTVLLVEPGSDDFGVHNADPFDMWGEGFHPGGSVGGFTVIGAQRTTDYWSKRSKARRGHNVHFSGAEGYDLFDIESLYAAADSYYFGGEAPTRRLRDHAIGAVGGHVIEMGHALTGVPDEGLRKPYHSSEDPRFVLSLYREVDGEGRPVGAPIGSLYAGAAVATTGGDAPLFWTHAPHDGGGRSVGRLELHAKRLVLDDAIAVCYAFLTGYEVGVAECRGFTGRDLRGRAAARNQWTASAMSSCEFERVELIGDGHGVRGAGQPGDVAALLQFAPGRGRVEAMQDVVIKGLVARGADQRLLKVAPEKGVEHVLNMGAVTIEDFELTDSHREGGTVGGTIGPVTFRNGTFARIPDRALSIETARETVLDGVTFSEMGEGAHVTQAPEAGVVRLRDVVCTDERPLAVQLVEGRAVVTGSRGLDVRTLSPPSVDSPDTLGEG